MTADISTTAQLRECEAVIERGMRTFIDVGRALAKVRDDRLYREQYETFEDYCQQRWGWSRSRAYRMIEASETVGALSPMGDTPMPTSERQARELSGLDPETAADVMHDAHEQTNGKPTAKAIKDSRDRIAPKPKPVTNLAPRPPVTDLITPADLDALNTPRDGLDEFTPAPEPDEDAITEQLIEEHSARPNPPVPAPEPSRPGPPPTTRRRPITDQARDAGWDLRKSVERISKLATDDRFEPNKSKVAPHLRGHLTNAIEVCQELLDRIDNTPKDTK